LLEKKTNYNLEFHKLELITLSASKTMFCIIGCGNLNRSDDGVGVCVAQRLAKHFSEPLRTDVKVFDAGTSGMDVMFQARGATSLIIVDASRSDSLPGTIFKVPGEALASVPEPSYTLHNFRWDHAIYAGRKMFKDDFPKNVTVYLIEAADLSFGLELSQSVSTAAESVVNQILTLVNEGQPQ